VAQDEIRLMIRPVQPSDLEQLLEIEAEAAPKSRYSLSELWSLCLAYPDTFLVAVSDAVDGYVVFSPDGHVISLAVARERRRQHIGTMLMQYVIACSAGKTLRLEVRVQNRAAQEFYQGLGFRKCAKMRRYYENGDDGLVMEREPTGNGMRQPGQPIGKGLTGAGSVAKAGRKRAGSR
jgi:ribosomal protein S18 acetylase RimI-like enzyme